jgi:hypothetical protein
MHIETVPKSALKKAACGSWLEYWENHAKRKPGKCAVLGCDRPAEVGAQIIKPSVGMSVVYIAALCSVHAEVPKTPLDVMESAPLVLANKGYACED